MFPTKAIILVLLFFGSSGKTTFKSYAITVHKIQTVINSLGFVHISDLHSTFMVSDVVSVAGASVDLFESSRAHSLISTVAYVSVTVTLCERGNVLFTLLAC